MKWMEGPNRMIAQYHPTWQLVVFLDFFNYLLETKVILHTSKYERAVFERGLQFYKDKRSRNTCKILYPRWKSGIYSRCIEYMCFYKDVGTFHTEGY